MEKIRAYDLQDKGMDTVDANLALGYKADPRDYGIGIQILKDLELSKVRLLTNNPKKMVALDGYGLSVVGRVAIEATPQSENLFYLQTKQQKLGHPSTFAMLCRHDHKGTRPNNLGAVGIPHGQRRLCESGPGPDRQQVGN